MSTYFLTDVRPDPTCSPEGRLACHKAVSPFKVTWPQLLPALSKSPWDAGAWWAVGSNVMSPAGSATPRHSQGHQGRPGGSFRWGLGEARRKRQRAFPRGPGSPVTGAQGISGHQTTVPSQPVRGTPSPWPRGRPPATRLVLSCRAFQPHTGFPVAKPHRPGA